MTKTISTKPIFTIGHYQLIHRTNDDYIRFEQDEKKTSLEFSLLRTFAILGILSACFYLTVLIADFFNIKTFITIIGWIVLFLLIVFGSRAFFSLFKIINTKNPNSPIIHYKFENVWLGILTILSIIQTYFRYGNIDHILLNHTVNILLVVLGVPYLIYQLRLILFK